MREPPSIPLITALQDMGATVKAFDPVGMELARIEIPPSWLPIPRQPKLISALFRLLRSFDDREIFVGVASIGPPEKLT